MSRVARSATAAALALALGAAQPACNDHFAFDVSAGASGGGVGASAGHSGSATTDGGFGGSAACGVHPQCPAGLHCSAGECYECTADTECVTANLPRCDLQRKRCVECRESSDCATDFVCDALGSRCLRRCSDDFPCPADLHGCDERRGVCYACDEDRECDDSLVGPLCAADGSGCVSCRMDSDCPGQRCDPLSGRCVACRDAADCASGWCDPRAGVCLPS